MIYSPLTKACVMALTVGSIVLTGCKSTTDTHSQAQVVAETSSSFSMPKYEKYQMANGLTVYLMQRKEVPLITLNAVVRAGSVNDAISGEAGMTAEALVLGAGNQSKTQIENAVDFLGASLGTGAGREGSSVNSSFMAKDMNTMLPIFTSVLTQPKFDSVEFAKMKKQQIAGLAQAKESPRNVIGSYFNKFMFGNQPYGNPTSGDRNSLKKINVATLKRFYQQYYQPSNTAITVVGDFNIAQMKAQLNQALGGWKNTHSISQPDLSANLTSYNSSRVLLVNKGDAIETRFLIGGKGVAFDNPDSVAISVVNTILGGRFTSWLNDELRVNAGLTYGAGSGFSEYSKAGLFRISSFTKTSTTKEAIDLALKTYDRLWSQGIDAATLKSAKAYVKGQFPPDFETNGQLAGLLGNMYLYGVGDSYINDFENKVNSLTVAETKRIIDTYFPREHLQFVLVGNAAKIAPIVAKYGKVTQVDIKAVGFDSK
ncbi:insulinase family protein [Parashewanella curva]|uniref:Insulinase family protein n=1 Tax=Parashewanella curva TaxID=2338552 RepID=A0A3L8Q0Y2_9GAMM|nr:pitrilysin family protein [Parashewanella curva]RLV60719.1 insulinase family protein [Parashewanella curva]